MAESTITTIYVLAAIIGMITGGFAIYLFFRQRQFTQPKLELIFGWNRLPDEIPRRLRKKPVSIFVIAPKRELRKPLHSFLIFTLNNPGRDAIKNVRVSFEYDSEYLIDNKTFVSLAQFEPVLIPDLSDSKKATLVSSKLTSEDIKTIIQERHVDDVGGRAQVTVELPIVRPGEGLIVYDRLMLKGSGPSGIQKLGFGAEGFKHIVARLTSIKGLLDYFVVNVFVYAENHENMNSKISVLRFESERDLTDGLIGFVESLWLGQFPKPGLYFSDPISRWLRRKFWREGRFSNAISREELGAIRHSEVAEIKAQGKKFMMEIPEHSETQYFALSTPNYDYFGLPVGVNDPESLRRWLGIEKAFSFKKTENSGSTQLEKTD